MIGDHGSPEAYYQGYTEKKQQTFNQHRQMTAANCQRISGLCFLGIILHTYLKHLESGIEQVEGFLFGLLVRSYNK